MNRKQKIELLRKIRTGKWSIKSMLPPHTYFFIELMPGLYEMRGKMYSENEYQEFCRKIKEWESNSIIWHEEKTYEDSIITMILDPRYEQPNYETQRTDHNTQRKDQTFAEN